MSLLVSPSPWHFPSILSKIVPHFLLRRAEAANLRLYTFKIPLCHGTSAAEAASQLLEEEAVSLQAAADALMEEASNGTGPSTALAKLQLQHRRVNIIALEAASGEGVAAVEAAFTDRSTSPQQSPPPPTTSEIQPLLQPRQQQQQPRPPAVLKLTSTHPNTYLDNWISISSQSDFLSFLPQPIDPTSTVALPASVRSRTSATSQSSTASISRAQASNPAPSPAPKVDGETSGTLTLWLYISAFHLRHPVQQHRAIANALTHSDAFVILSLVDRRFTTVILVLLLRFWMIWAETVFGFPWHRDVLTLLASFPVPIVPVLAAWLGVKECLGAMTFEKLMGMVDAALGFRCPQGEAVGGQWIDDGWVEGRKVAERVGWRFEARRVGYRWPFGRVTAFVGRRTDVRDRPPR